MHGCFSGRHFSDWPLLSLSLSELSFLHPSLSLSLSRPWCCILRKDVLVYCRESLMPAFEVLSGEEV